MSKLVDKILTETLNNSRLNELFGMSKNEKEIKQLKSELQKARQEAEKFDPSRLVGQPGGRTPEERNENMRVVVGVRIKEAKELMPYLAKFIPKLFVLKPNSTNAASIKYKNHADCILPAEWYFVTGGAHELEPNIAKDNFMKYVDRELSEIMRQNKIK